MPKTQNSDKLKLIKQEEEAREETHYKTGTKHKMDKSFVKCHLCFVGSIVLLILLLCLINPIWPSHFMTALQKNETVSTSFNGGLRFTEIMIGLQSQNSNSINNVVEQIREEKISQNEEANFSYHNNYFKKLSSTSAFSLQKIIENEQIKSKVKQSSEHKKGGIQQEVASHRITVNGEKLIFNNNLLNQSKDICTKNPDIQFYTYNNHFSELPIIVLPCVVVFFAFLIYLNLGVWPRGWSLATGC